MYENLPFAKELGNFVSSEFYNAQLSESKQINKISVCTQKYITILPEFIAFHYYNFKLFLL